MKKYAAAFGMALVIVATNGVAQEKAPTLTTEQRQAIQILAQRMELAQLHAQMAQQDFERASGELTSLLKTLDKPGYTLDLQTMQYTAKKDKKE